MKLFTFIAGLSLLICSCGSNSGSHEEIEIVTFDTIISKPVQTEINGLSIVILGTCQDAGSPHIGCQKVCCKDLHENPDQSRLVVSLGVVDPKNQQRFMFEATPDISSQINLLNNFGDFEKKKAPDGIFITHAHIGHYTGLMYLGKEALNTNNIPLYLMEQMERFISENGPWSQLVTDENIAIQKLVNRKKTEINSQLSITPIIVPHRDEYSETVGFYIHGPKKTALFIPDIDKWSKWDQDILEEIKNVDYAFIDATFYADGELPNRDMSKIPHPFVSESMDLFADLSVEDKAKVIFIHFNHTNPLLNQESEAYQTVLDKGFKVAKLGDVFPL